MIEKHGADRVVLTLGWPMADLAADIAAIQALGLPDDDAVPIVSGSLERLLARPVLPT